MSIPAWLYLSCPLPLPSPILCVCVCVCVCVLVVFDQCCWLLYCCWLPSRALLSSLLLSCFTQCYCEALRAQTKWGALEVFFIIIIIIIISIMIIPGYTGHFSSPVTLQYRRRSRVQCAGPTTASLRVGLTVGQSVMGHKEKMLNVNTCGSTVCKRFSLS